MYGCADPLDERRNYREAISAVGAQLLTRRPMGAEANSTTVVAAVLQELL